VQKDLRLPVIFQSFPPGFPGFSKLQINKAPGL
jgi:hypothetical protein